MQNSTKQKEKIFCMFHCNVIPKIAQAKGRRILCVSLQYQKQKMNGPLVCFFVTSCQIIQSKRNTIFASQGSDPPTREADRNLGLRRWRNIPLVCFFAIACKRVQTKSKRNRSFVCFFAIPCTRALSKRNGHLLCFFAIWYKRVQKK